MSKKMKTIINKKNNNKIIKINFTALLDSTCVIYKAHKSTVQKYELHHGREVLEKLKNAP